MTFTLTFSLDNAEFTEHEAYAIVSTLQRIAGQIADGRNYRQLQIVRDTNGHTIGQYGVTNESEDTHDSQEACGCRE